MNSGKLKENNSFYFSVSMYSGALLIRTPIIRTLQLKDDVCR